MDTVTKTKEEKKNYAYDYSLKTKDDRQKFVEEKLGFILNIPPYKLMGYSNEHREQDSKSNRIPRMIDAYTSYFLKSLDVESSRLTEYSFYIDRREQVRRKGQKATIFEANSFDGSQSKPDDNNLPLHETYAQNGSTILDLFTTETHQSQALKYAISRNKLSISDYKKVLSMTSDILLESKDEELKEALEQVVFNCAITAKDDKDTEILKQYIQGNTLREISEDINVSFNTVKNRIDKMLKWIK